MNQTKVKSNLYKNHFTNNFNEIIQGRERDIETETDGEDGGGELVKSDNKIQMPTHCTSWGRG